ncbi:MAG: YgiT-type zinc finger protein [Candidatus Thermoplasmatota archaeon]|nr:YgiT-type zinc finger protein [Candidatus Thermoplasmatota archaeon]MBU4256430.1 YgiT-type zinc finger protein [Candidatus Thermoplasmatota archaeon]MCG2827476.1 YgiT-type zinc finger protein [Thermoplasmatales archaeon]
MKCPMCNEKMERKKKSYSYSGTNIGVFDADVCSKCGEVFFTEKASDEIDAKAKEIGMWGFEKKSKITYSGNSLMVRIPNAISKFLSLKKGKEITIRPEGKKKIVVEIS